MLPTLRTLLIVLALNVAACAGNKDTLLPDDGQTIDEIYTQHFADIGLNGTLAARQAVSQRTIAADGRDLSGFVRNAHVELDRHFPRLPNPTLVLYVFPHLAGSERVPIPGFATTFPMYRQVEYALPGEVHSDAPQPLRTP